MTGYLLRRLAYGVLILLGVNLLTFGLFFAVNTPDDMARLSIGGKYVTPEAVESWKAAHGYDLPLLWNDGAQGLEKATKTIFYTRSVPLLKGDFGLSDAGRSINREIARARGSESGACASDLHPRADRGGHVFAPSRSRAAHAP